MIEVGVLFQQAAAALRRERHATYRLQLGSAHGFDAVASLGPYLDALGVSDAYLSPCFRCGPGSSHGYDVTDHNAFNPEIGGAAAFDHMAAALAARGLGLILDVVPNHMGIAGRRQSLVAGRPGERPGFAPRRVLRHRLDTVQARAARSRAPARPARPVRPRAGVAAAPARVRGRRLPPPLRRRAPAHRPRHLRADPDRAPARPRGPPGPGRHGAARAAQHPDRARAPARAYRDRSRAPRGAAPREGDRQAAPRRAREGVGRDPRAHRGDGARGERRPRGTRRASTRSTACSRPRPTGSRTGAWRATR